MKQEFCILIMAGGIGSRFWPKSTEEKPKQFLNLINNQSMLQETIDRIKEIVPIEKIFISTNEKYVNLVKKQIPNLPIENIIIEPASRNTAPCILLSLLYINQLQNNKNIVVLPSDHMIQNKKEFIKTIKKGIKFAEKKENIIITLGITPTRPETKYGYINIDNQTEGEFIKVKKFVEKPSEEKAKEYIASQKYLWNLGMTIFNIKYMLEELEKNYTSSYNLLKQLPSIHSKNYKQKLKKLYPECEKISLDYAVLEKSQNIYTIKSNFDWDDIGSWDSLERYLPKDKDNNVIKGTSKTYNSHHNIIYGGDKKIIFIDVDNLFLIESDDIIIVGPKEKITNLNTYKD